MATHEQQPSLDRWLRDRVRVFNKWVLNPVTLRLAGRPLVPYGLVRHEGRRSGRTYDTPVLVGTAGDRLLIPLLYGPDVDWAWNVRAADGCTVAWQGTAYRATSPELVDLDAGRAAFPGWSHRLVAAAGAERYLRLDRGEAVPEQYRDFTSAHSAGPVVAAAAVLALLTVVTFVRSVGGSNEPSTWLGRRFRR